MYLLDTNVISEFTRPRPHASVVSWLEATPSEHLYVCAVTLGEIQIGIEKMRRKDEMKAASLEVWLDLMEQTWKVLPVDGAAFRLWARLRHGRARALSEDAMIAATAIVHGFTVVTRNVRDFKALGVATLDPFARR